MARRRGFDTISIHGGQFADAATGARAVPIYQSAAFVFKNADHAARLFAHEEAGPIYTRIGNPTNAVMEDRLALLEGAEAGLATSSGMAATLVAILNCARAGDSIISGSQLYGGTYNLLAKTLPRYGINCCFVDASDPDAWAEAIRTTPRAKAVFVETPGNPSLNWVDVPTVSALAREAGLVTIVDNTLNTPFLFRPIDHGADVVVHSVTKFLGGHGTAIAGAVVGKSDFILQSRAELHQDLGTALSPFNAFLILLGMETLSLRMERHCQNAMAMARFLESHPLVSWVRYPGLESHPDHALAGRLSPKGYGGMVSFGVKGGFEAGKKVQDSVRLFSLLANIGDAKSLIVHPASTTHEQLSHEQRRLAGVSDDMIRLSVGIETVDDLIDDLDRAIKRAVG